MLSKYIYRCLLVLLFSPCLMQAQTEVKRYNATGDTDYGIVYRLPKTQIEVIATLCEERYTPGKYALWAERYLGNAVPMQPKTTFRIERIEIRPIGVADMERQYLIAFDKKTVAPFVMLADNNLLYSINGSELPKPMEIAPLPPNRTPDTNMPALPREYSLATSEAKQAELAATYLYEVREATMNILTGEVENMPKDGESMRLMLDKLRSEENRSTRLFVGDTTLIYTQQRFTIEPESEDMTGRQLFRFSCERGIVHGSAPEATPVVFDLRIKDRAPELSDKDRKRLEKIDGVVYNVPGSAQITITHQGKTLGSASIAIAQLGTIQSLSKKMFNIKDGTQTAVYLDLSSGAVLRIVNE